MPIKGPVTDLLVAWSGGDEAALSSLMNLVHAELQEAARRAMAYERPSHTLQPAALVNEVYLRLLSLKKVSWASRKHFLGFAARLMRRVLVDHARAVNSAKRGGDWQRITLEKADLAIEGPSIDLLALNEALEKLEAVDPNLVRIIELRYFTGLTEDETAAVLEVAPSTVYREWKTAVRLLARMLGAAGEDGREAI